nr:MAG TPA: hypothetical protein [Caudoviricetes sp.]
MTATKLKQMFKTKVNRIIYLLELYIKKFKNSRSDKK